MSWQTWIEKLEKDGICQYAGIFGRAGGLWAETEKSKCPWSFPEDQCTKFAGIMDAEDKSICANGAVLGGLKFLCTAVDKEGMIFQGKGDYKDASLVVVASASALIVGYNGTANIKTQQVKNAVEGIKEYFKTIGY